MAKPFARRRASLRASSTRPAVGVLSTKHEEGWGLGLRISAAGFLMNGLYRFGLIRHNFLGPSNETYSIAHLNNQLTQVQRRQRSVSLLRVSNLHHCRSFQVWGCGVSAFM